jgi:membrane fusion protein (multidrug efflux system)
MALLCLLCACDSQPHGNGPPPEKAPQVAVVTLKSEAFPLRAELAGRVSAWRVSQVRPQVGGVIEKRYFDEGAQVKPGQLLYQINDDSYQARYAQASAELAIEKAALVNLRIIAERHQALLKTHHVTAQDHDLAQANHAQGLARVKAREATVQSARIDLRRTQVRAAIGGRIGRSAVTEGALVTVDQEAALATIQQVDPIYVDVVQSSRQLTQLKQQLGSGALQPGKASVSLALEDGQVYGHAGVLKFTDMNVDTEAGVVMLRAQFPNPGGLLLPGMYVRAKVEQAVLRAAVLVPQQAVHYNERNEALVWVIGAGNKAEQRVLTLMGSHGDQWVSSAGVSAGERLVVEGAMKLSAGLAVAPVAWAKAPALAQLAKRD